jgi:predicted RNA binding protein YcfA (HicA-like mRNA interferase family)
VPTTVREAIRMIEKDGWFLVGARGQPPSVRHLTKPGRVTIPGKESADLSPATLSSSLKQAGMKGKKEMRYAVVIERAGNNYSAYVPDLPGCVSTGDTMDEAEKNIRESHPIPH